MPNLKVLRHTVYLKCKHKDTRLLDQLNNYYEEIEPVYHRDGEYLLGDKCWFEVRGRAFTKRKEDFLFKLRQHDMEDVDLNVVKQLKAIQRLSKNVLTTEQRNIIRDYDHFLCIREMKRKGIKSLRELKAGLKLIIDKRQ